MLMKFLCIESLPFDSRAAALFLFPVAGRWAMVPMASWAPYAREEEGLGKTFAGCDSITLVRATAITALFFTFFLGLRGLFTLVVLLVLTYAITGFFKKRLGGVTGDVFGFQSEVFEVMFLVMVLASF